MKQMAWDEFCTLLSGLNENTPLVKMAQVRKERDPEVIKNFTEEQKRINAEWQRKIMMEDVSNMTKEDILERCAPVSRLLDSVMRQQGKI